MEERKIIINIKATCTDDNILVDGHIEKNHTSDREMVLVLANTINKIFNRSELPNAYLWKQLKKEFNSLN